MFIQRTAPLLLAWSVAGLAPLAAAQGTGVGTFYIRFLTYTINPGTPLPGTPAAGVDPALPDGFAASDVDFHIDMSDLTLIPSTELLYGGSAAFGVLGNGHYGLVQNLNVLWTSPVGGTLEGSDVMLVVDVYAQVGGVASFLTQCVPAGDPDDDFRLATYINGSNVPYDLAGAPVGLVTEDVPFDLESDWFPDAPLRGFRFTPLGTITSGVPEQLTIVFDLGVLAGARLGEGIGEPLFASSGDSSAAVELTFDEVTVAGVSTLTVSTTGPAVPGRFSLGPDPVYYDISTTAMFTGGVEVCIDYSGLGFTEEDEEYLCILHTSDGENWVELTGLSIDTVNDVICGTTTSFSPFVIARDLVAMTLDTSGDIEALPLGEFLAPNSHAAAGRRQALANRALDAALAMLADDIAGAIDELESILDRIDGAPAPPDWMAPTLLRDQLRADVIGLIELLSTP